jgi:hypothetical protein
VAIALAPKVEQAKLQATATDALRREWDKLSTEYNFVLEKKRAVPPLVMQLDELSRLLTDDTWVQQFDLKGKELQIQGETASSSKLIALVESSKMLSEASFRSPLTKGQAPNSERFHLGGEVKPLSVSAFTALRPAAPVPAVTAVPPIAPTALPTLQNNAKVDAGKSGSAAAPTPPSGPQNINKAEVGKLGAVNTGKVPPPSPPSPPKPDIPAKPALRPSPAQPAGTGNVLPPPASPKASDNSNPGTTRPNLGRQP